MKSLSRAELAEISARGGEVRRNPKSPPKAKAPKQPIVEKPPVIVRSPDHSDELKQLVQTLGEKLSVQPDKPRRPWRIKVNRDSRGLAETYDVIPV